MSSSRLGQLYRHLPSDTVYSVTGIEQFHYGFYTTDSYIMSPWVEADINLDIVATNLESIEWQYMYDLRNSNTCSHPRTSFIGIAGSGKTVCVVCDEEV